MTSALHAAYYADRAVQRTVEIRDNVRLARDTYRVRFACPEIARTIVPGQFLMLRLDGVNDPLIGRPLALYDIAGDELDVVYLAKGKFTSRLKECRAGDKLSVWGPLGNGFSTTPVEHLIMVAGGIGQTPFVTLAAEFLGRRTFGDPPRLVAPAQRITLCYGARSAAYLAGVEDFERLGVEVRIATDDGSRGTKGLVTDILPLPGEGRGEGLNPLHPIPHSQRAADPHPSPLPQGEGTRIVTCGPEPMMAAVAKLAMAHGIPCEVSLETPMACGIGICFTCVAKVKDENGAWDYKRTCVEGPVFDACSIEW